MKLKKKYCLIAFCAVTLLVFVSGGVQRISQKAYEKEIERMYDLYEQLAAERPDTFELTNVVEPAFIKKYDYLTESNLNAFVNDWKAWSKELRSFSSDSHVNEAIGRIVTIYTKTEHADSCIFYSLPSNINVSIYPCKLEDYTKTDTPDLKPVINAAKHYAHYIPDFKADKDIVYVSPEIEKILSSYVGGVSESEKYVYGSPLTPIKKERLSELRQLIPAAYGHWGGYWHFESMPIIFTIFMFQDGFITELRKSWCEGDFIFIPYDIKKDPVLLCDWIE